MTDINQGNLLKKYHDLPSDVNLLSVYTLSGKPHNRFLILSDFHDVFAAIVVYLVVIRHQRLQTSLSRPIFPPLHQVVWPP